MHVIPRSGSSPGLAVLFHGRCCCPLTATTEQCPAYLKKWLSVENLLVKFGPRVWIEPSACYIDWCVVPSLVWGMMIHQGELVWCVPKKWHEWDLLSRIWRPRKACQPHWSFGKIQLQCCPKRSKRSESRLVKRWRVMTSQRGDEVCLVDFRSTVSWTSQVSLIFSSLRVEAIPGASFWTRTI